MDWFRKSALMPHSRLSLLILGLLAFAGFVGSARAASVTYIGEADDTGPSASDKFGSDGYDLYATMPNGGNFNFGNGGTRITRLPSYVAAITPAQGSYTWSSSQFSLIAVPQHPGTFVRSGTVATHAPPGQTVPLIDIALVGNVPEQFYVSFTTNINPHFPEDYPNSITLTVGPDTATAQAPRAASATGGVDVFVFRIGQARAGDHVIVSASQSTANRFGGRYNPSVSALLFGSWYPQASLTLSAPAPQAPNPVQQIPPAQQAPPAQQTQAVAQIPSAAPVCSQNGIPMNGCTPGSTGGQLQVISGSGDFAGISATNKTLNVYPGAMISGAVSLRALNLGPPNAVAPLIFTPSWGDPAKSWRLIQNWIPSGQSNQTAQIALQVPADPGTYHIVFAFAWEIGGDHVASATNYATGMDRWNDGNDIAAMSADQLTEAQTKGYTSVNWLNGSGYAHQYVPADAITVVVKTPIMQYVVYGGAAALLLGFAWFVFRLVRPRRMAR